MNEQEQLEKINEQAQVIVEEIEKYKTATNINETSAEGFKKVAEGLNSISGKIRPLAGLGFLRLQYITIGLSIINIVLMCVLLFLFFKK